VSRLVPHLKTVAFGCVDSLRPLQTGHISAHDNRLEIHLYVLSKWHVNAEQFLSMNRRNLT